MKIRLLTDSRDWGGTEVHVLQLVRTLAERGHDVAILELGHTVYATASEAVDPRVAVVDASPDMADQPPRRPRDWRASRRLLQALSADVCILVKGFIDSGTWQLDLLTRLSATRYIAIEHTTCPMPPKAIGRHCGGLVPGLGLWWHRKRAQRRVRGLTLHRVICVSDAVRQVLANGYGFAPHKLVTVRNGVDAGAFRRDDAARARLRQQWGVAPDSLLFGAVGRLTRVKNYRVALDLFARLAREFPTRDLRLAIAGDGPDKAALESAARASGVGDRISLPGFTLTPNDVLSALDVFLMPSLTEGLPIALLEAMACGCCPIATDVGGVPEVITGPDVGWLCRSGDDEAFLQAMRQAANATQQDLVALGHRARAHVVTHFNAATQFGACADAIEATCLAA